MAECKLRRPDGTVNAHAFAQGPCTFGRGGAANLRIDDEFMSRVHCEVFLREMEVVIRDMNSRNGTFVNGQRVEERVLKSGDRIKMGETDIACQVDAEMVPPKIPGELATREINAVFRIIQKEPVRVNPSSTVLIPHPPLPSLTQPSPPKS